MQVGDTVSLRVRTEIGPTDVVGLLLESTGDTLTLRRRDGAVTKITRDRIEAGRIVPPGPARTVGAGDLQRVAAAGWRAAETSPLGDWLLRAAGGFTGRANSALAIGDPGRPLSSALDELESWYDERGLSPRVQMPSADATPGLDAALDERGWTRSALVHVMTAELGPVLRRESVAAPVETREAPDEAWLASYRQDSPDRLDGALPTAARELLTRHDAVCFAAVRDHAGCQAIARSAVDGRWAGLFCVEVSPAQRGRGLGTDVSLTALRWAASRGARRAYLQVAADNASAVRLYERLGFAVHHDYVYRLRDVSGH